VPTRKKKGGRVHQPHSPRIVASASMVKLSSPAALQPTPTFSTVLPLHCLNQSCWLPLQPKGACASYLESLARKRCYAPPCKPYSNTSRNLISSFVGPRTWRISFVNCTFLTCQNCTYTIHLTETYLLLTTSSRPNRAVQSSSSGYVSWLLPFSPLNPSASESQLL